MLRRLLIFAVSALPLLAAPAKFDAAVATNQLGLDLYRQLARQNSSGNLVISPCSIDSALALAYSGANGATRAEMAKALHFPDDDASLQESFGGLRASLDNVARRSAAQSARDREDESGAIEWYQANHLFGQRGYTFNPSFLALMKNGYDAPFEQLDFRSDAELARATINSWVEEQTHQRIRDVIPSGGVSSDTRLVLVNTLYLKAPWQDPFKKSETHPRPFHFTAIESADVPVMQRTAYLVYAKQNNFTVVVLDYVGSGLQFLILLPDPDTDCDALAREFTSDNFRTWATMGKEARPTRVELYMPRFRLAGSTLSLGAALRGIGITRAFDEPRGSADFGRIASRQPDDYLALAEVFHKVFIAVDEEGTEAAAATVMAMYTLGVSIHPPPPPVVVRVDRPFLFAIQDRGTGACLFLGRITDPR